MHKIKTVRWQTAEARRTTILQPVKQKPRSQKERQDEKAEDYVSDEGKDKTPENQLNEVEIGNLPEKKIQNNDNEDDPGPWKRMEAKIKKMQEMFNKDLEELKNKQT